MLLLNEKFAIIIQYRANRVTLYYKYVYVHVYNKL